MQNALLNYAVNPIDHDDQDREDSFADHFGVFGFYPKQCLGAYINGNFRIDRPMQFPFRTSPDSVLHRRFRAPPLQPR